jgi:hypothetical protein
MHPWPPISPDLSPIVYCILGWMMDIVYRRKAQTHEELILAHFMHTATEIRDNTFLKICYNLCKIQLKTMKSTEINLFL